MSQLMESTIKLQEALENFRLALTEGEANGAKKPEAKKPEAKKPEAKKPAKPGKTKAPDPESPVEEDESLREIELSDLQSKGQKLLAEGHKQELIALLKEFKLKSVSSCPPDQFEEFYTRLMEI